MFIVLQITLKALLNMEIKSLKDMIGYKEEFINKILLVLIVTNLLLNNCVLKDIKNKILIKKSLDFGLNKFQ